MALRRLGLLRGATDLLRLLGAANGGDRRECVDGLRRDPHLLRLADWHRLSLPSQTANQTVGGGRNSVSALQGIFGVTFQRKPIIFSLNADWFIL